MKSFGKRADGLRLERMRASPRWAGEGFRNVHPILPGDDPEAPKHLETVRGVGYRFNP